MCEKIVKRALDGKAMEDEVAERMEEEATTATMTEEIGGTVDTVVIEVDQGEAVIEMLMMIEDMTIEGAEMTAIDTMIGTAIEDIEVVETMTTGTMEEDIHMNREIIIVIEMMEAPTHLTTAVHLDRLCPICQVGCTDKAPERADHLQ